MGRELKRVPLDFDYELNRVWYGYFMNLITTCHNEGDNNAYCQSCKQMARIKEIPMTSYGCPDYEMYFSEVTKMLKSLCEPPKGEGYQLWETTSEGSPTSPVFETLDELCSWCEDNATIFASIKATKKEWKKMLDNDTVCANHNGVIFI